MIKSFKDVLAQLVLDNLGLSVEYNPLDPANNQHVQNHKNPQVGVPGL